MQRTDSGRGFARADVIYDFQDSGADRIDLSALFPEPLVYMGTRAFTGQGQVRVHAIATSVFVDINLVGGLTPDMQIILANTTLAEMSKGDFYL